MQKNILVMQISKDINVVLNDIAPRPLSEYQENRELKESEIIIEDEIFRMNIQFELDNDHVFDDLLITLEYIPSSISSEVYIGSINEDPADELRTDIHELIHNVFSHTIEVYEKQDVFGHKNILYLIGEEHISRGMIKKRFTVRRPVKVFPV